MPPPIAENASRDRSQSAGCLLVVGRVAPNKCIEDCLFVLDYLQKNIDPGWRMVIVGSAFGTETYRADLDRLIRVLSLTGVEFTGGVPQDRLLQHFRQADALLCMSEHEGFGVPLVEAMRLDVPVFAFAAGATAETLGSAGVLVQQKDWPAIAAAVSRLACNSAEREQVLDRQRARYRELSPEAVWPLWERWLVNLT